MIDPFLLPLGQFGGVLYLFDQRLYALVLLLLKHLSELFDLGFGFLVLVLLFLFVGVMALLKLFVLVLEFTVLLHDFGTVDSVFKARDVPVDYFHFFFH